MPNTNTPVVQPLIQDAQKCAWCYGYLYIGQDCADYNGNDPRFTGWICHAECNNVPVDQSLQLSVSSNEALQLTVSSNVSPNESL